MGGHGSREADRPGDRSLRRNEVGRNSQIPGFGFATTDQITDRPLNWEPKGQETLIQ